MFSFMIISADGYHADPGQALDWQTIDEEFSHFALTQCPRGGHAGIRPGDLRAHGRFLAHGPAMSPTRTSRRR